MEVGDTIGARKRHCKLSLPGDHLHDDHDDDDDDEHDDHDDEHGDHDDEDEDNDDEHGKDHSVLGIYGLGIEFCHYHHSQFGDIKYQNNAQSHSVQYKRKVVKCVLNSEDKMRNDILRGYSSLFQLGCTNILCKP